MSVKLSDQLIFWTNGTNIGLVSLIIFDKLRSNHGEFTEYDSQSLIRNCMADVNDEILFMPTMTWHTMDDKPSLVTFLTECIEAQVQL